METILFISHFKEKKQNTGFVSIWLVQMLMLILLYLSCKGMGSFVK